MGGVRSSLKRHSLRERQLLVDCESGFDASAIAEVPSFAGAQYPPFGRDDGIPRFTFHLSRFTLLPRLR